MTSTAVLGLLLPALTLGTLLLVQPHEPVDSARPPEPTTLKSASVACPSAPDGTGTAYVATGQPDVRGEVTVTAAGKESSVPVRRAGSVACRGPDRSSPRARATSLPG